MKAMSKYPQDKKKNVAEMELEKNYYQNHMQNFLDLQDEKGLRVLAREKILSKLFLQCTWDLASTFRKP